MLDMEQMGRRYRQLQRATVARSALDIIAQIFIGCAFCFWGVAFWQLLAPPQLVSLGTITVMVLTVVYGLAAPLLLSMLVPTTPAGQMLQKTQWATVGFPVIVASAVFLCWHGYTLISAWLSAQGQIEKTTGLPVLVATGQVTPIAISLTIAFILIPALAWIQVSPQMWLSQIQQAHQVKKLEMQQRGELAIIKASILSAERKAVIGWANLLPLEQQEVMGTIRGLLMAQSDSQRSIVRTLGLSAELERDIMDDTEIADRMDYVAERINVIPDLLPAPSPQLPAEIYPIAHTAQQDAPPASPQPRPAAAAIPAPPQSAAVSRSQPQYAEEYHAARGRLYGVWSSSDLGEVIGKSPRSALERIYAWIAVGLVQRGVDGKGTYYFTESEV